MSRQIELEKLNRAVASVRAVWPDCSPKQGLILGSGWGEVADGLDAESLPYEKIDGLGSTGVDGHAGHLLRVKGADSEVLVFCGRRHYYEGEGWTPVVLPVYLLHALGAKDVLLTNAAGGIREDLKPGTLMVISDHINMMGDNPLRGPHRPELGVRFPDQSAVYDASFQKELLAAGADTTGVYLATSGPIFETPAEIRAFRTLGADAVGMSTVPEAMLASALGLRVGGLSCICNWAAGLGSGTLTHEEIGEVANQSMSRMQKILRTLL